MTEAIKGPSLAQQMRDRLNKKAGKELVTADEEDKVQVKDWLVMPLYFQEIVGDLGLPQGHITQLFSETPDSGKTTALIEAMIICQRAGGIVNLIDSEQKFPWARLVLMGGIAEDVNHMEVDSLEEAWEAWDHVAKVALEMRNDGIEVPIMAAWDSVPASVPDAIINEKEAGKLHVAVEAKINNKNVRKLRQITKRAKLTAVFINHSYMSMPIGFGARPVEILKGGAEMYFMTTLAIRFKKGAMISREFKKETQRIGQTVHVEVKKGHFSGRTVRKTLNIIDRGFVSNEELAEYKLSLRGKI